MKSKTKIVSITLIFSAFMISVSCVPKQEKVEKIIEDGVEVMLNHLEPYKIKGEPSTFDIEEKFVIDFEKDDITEYEISDIRGFDVDSEGNIYLSSYKGSDNCIFKFDGKGNFITSFGRKGQGPGELRYARNLYVNNQDLIQTIASSRHRLISYEKDGSLVDEIPLKPDISRIIPLKTGKFLVSKRTGARESLYYFRIALFLYNAEFGETKELEKVIIPNRASASYWMASNRNIYVGNDERGYEIWVYDLEGNLRRKIKKEYESVEIPDEIKEGIKEAYEMLRRQSRRPSKTVEAPAHWPPFSAFFIDEKERLYVRSWEKGENIGESIHDVFNQDGAFIERISLNIYFSRECKYAVVKKNLLYFLREKESGYKELVVSRIKWEKQIKNQLEPKSSKATAFLYRKKYINELLTYLNLYKSNLP
ncbi:MAG: 6-bladed beta-propeller [Candidatus Aminicenantes bacterium]|nr:6-bladed beta-propeller [Candidatus Aminicenantes bacterium]